jgi:hypothetical protein
MESVDKFMAIRFYYRSSVGQVVVAAVAFRVIFLEEAVVVALY